MKIKKQISIGVGFANKAPYNYEGENYEADIIDGDIVTIKSEVTVVNGQHGEQKIAKIETRNGEKAVSLNPTTLNCFIDEWGDGDELDSEALIGEKVRVNIVKEVIGGKKCQPVYLAPSGWELDEWDSLERKVGKTTPTQPTAPTPAEKVAQNQPDYPEHVASPDAF